MRSCSSPSGSACASRSPPTGPARTPPGRSPAGAPEAWCAKRRTSRSGLWWASRQALAARDAGAEVQVLVLHRPLPPLAALRSGDARRARAAIRQPRRAMLDGIEVRYLRYLSPPRPWSYQAWGAWAAPVLAPALRLARRRFAFDLIHAHYAVPAGDAVRRAVPSAPVVLSVHGHDVQGAAAGGRNVRAAP